MPNSWFSAPNESCNDLHTTQKPKTLSLNKHRNRTKSTLRRRRPRAIKRPRVADPCPERLRDTLAWSPTEYFLKFWMILAAMRHIASPLRVPPMSLTESLIGWYSEILSMLRTVEQCKGKTHKERFKNNKLLFQGTAAGEERSLVFPSVSSETVLRSILPTPWPNCCAIAFATANSSCAKVDSCLGINHHGTWLTKVTNAKETTY